MSAAKRGGLLRAVLDTNVYVSAFISTRGVSHELWQRAIRGDYILLVSPAVLREIADVLRKDLAWPEFDIIAQLKMVVRVALIVQPKATLRAMKADPDDDRILGCAVAGGADLIASYDHHLRSLTAFRHIGIVHPVDLLRTL